MSDWDLVEAERRDLADFAAALSSEQWNASTLCGEWKVHDAVAPVVGVPSGSVCRMLAAGLKNGFNVNKALARHAIAGASDFSGD